MVLRRVAALLALTALILTSGCCCCRCCQPCCSPCCYPCCKPCGNDVSFYPTAGPPPAPCPGCGY